MEGPFINPNMKGAHKEHLIQEIRGKGIQEMEDFYGSLNNVSIITLAPELAGENMQAIQQLVDRNIVVSIGKIDISYFFIVIMKLNINQYHDAYLEPFWINDI